MKFLKQLCFTTFLSALCSALIITPSFALSDATLDFFAENHIYYYNPEGLSLGGASCSAEEAQNYAGATVITTAQVSTINYYKAYYENAASTYGFPWRILASIHLVENNLSLRISTAGGVYNIPDYSDGLTGTISLSEFQEQTNALAEYINEIITNKNISTIDEEGIKLIFYYYNLGDNRKDNADEESNPTPYAIRAKNMGYSNIADGSTYVMNRYDARRDPYTRNTSEGWDDKWLGMYDSAGAWNDKLTTDKFGAFVVYEAMGGTGTCIGGLRSGGYTDTEEIKRVFLSDYINGDCANYSQNCLSKYKNEPGANCVSYVQWWLAKYTTLSEPYDGTNAGTTHIKLPNGRDVVNALTNYGVPEVYSPQPYTIFSYDYWMVDDDGINKNFGHTGVILGVDEDGYMYIGQMAYGSHYSYGLNNIKVKIENWDGRNKHPQYADVSGYLSGGAF